MGIKKIGRLAIHSRDDFVGRYVAISAPETIGELRGGAVVLPIVPRKCRNARGEQRKDDLTHYRGS
jgi:hypothetical protein